MYFLINLTKRSVMFTRNKCFYEMKKNRQLTKKRNSPKTFGKKRKALHLENNYCML